MRAFEIHTFREGQWKVDSVYDDRELAMHEARKVDENGRYAGVRVIEEKYDESSDLTTTRTIFRGRTETAKSTAPKPTARKSGRAVQRGGARRDRINHHVEPIACVGIDILSMAVANSANKVRSRDQLP